MRSRVMCCGLFTVLAVVGCSESYPHYTVEGTMETRVLTVHVDAETTREVNIGTGGLTGRNKADLQGGQTITVENHGVSVTLSGKTDDIKVGTVKCDGKEVPPSKNLL